MSKDLRFRSGGQLLPSCDGAWKQQQHGGAVAWMRLDSKHSRGLWAVLALVVVLLLVSSVWRVNDGSEQAGEVKHAQLYGSVGCAQHSKMRDVKCSQCSTATCPRAGLHSIMKNALWLCVSQSLQASCFTASMHVAPAAAMSVAVDGASLVNGAVTSGQPSSSSSRGWSKIGRSGSSLGSLKAEKAAFLERHGKQYGYNGWLDKNWQREVGDRLGSTLRHYLDFTGVRAAEMSSCKLLCCLCMSVMLMAMSR